MYNDAFSPVVKGWMLSTLAAVWMAWHSQGKCSVKREPVLVAQTPVLTQAGSVYLPQAVDQGTAD